MPEGGGGRPKVVIPLRVGGTLVQTGITADGTATASLSAGTDEFWSDVGVMVLRTAGSSSFTVDLEVSQDDTNWHSSAISTPAAGIGHDARGAAVPCQFVRARVRTVGVGNTLAVTLTALR